MDVEVLMPIIMLVIFFGIFWFFLIRPQKKREKEHQQMVDNLEIGDKIITIGGIKAKVIKIKDDIIRLRISSDVDIDVVKNAIGSLENEKGKQKQEQAENKDDGDGEE